MRKFWEKDFLYTVARRYADATIRGCFSSFKIEGMENIPSDGCVIFAPNHCNALMDALLLLVCYRGDIAFGARADIFKNPVAAAGLNFCRIVPIARERDGRQAVADSVKGYSDIVECLDHGVPFTIFAEGTHRARRTLLPMKKGISRMAVKAVRDTGKQVWIVPVGIEYDEFFRMMGTVKVRFGEAFAVNGYLESQESEPVVLRQITDELSSRLKTLFTYFPNDDSYDAAFAQWEASRKPSKAAVVARRIGGVLFFPVTALAAILGAPILIPSEIMVARMKDKSWANTARFCFNLFLRPVVALIALAVLWPLCGFLWGLVAFVAIMKSPNVFHWGLRLFR